MSPNPTDTEGMRKDQQKWSVPSLQQSQQVGPTRRDGHVSVRSLILQTGRGSLAKLEKR